MSTVTLIKRAKKFIATRDSARATAENANKELGKCLEEALMLARTVADSMEVYRLTNDNKLEKIALRKAITLLGTSAKHLWDLPLIKDKLGYFSDPEFQKKERLILSKITVGWLMSLEKEVPDKYRFDLKRHFGAELRERFEQEAKAATSYEQFELISKFYSNLPVDTDGVWREDGWQPEQAPQQRPFRASDPNNF